MFASHALHRLHEATNLPNDTTTPLETNIAVIHSLIAHKHLHNTPPWTELDVAEQHSGSWCDFRDRVQLAAGS